MKPSTHKTLAIIEVILAVFWLVPFLDRNINTRLPGLESWQVDTLGFPFPVLNHVLMILASLLLIAISRRDFASYGLNFNNLKAQLDIAGTCFLPVVLASMPFGMGVDYTSWRGAFLLAGVQIMLFFVLGWLLKNKPPAIAVGSWLLMAVGQVSLAAPPMSKAVAVFVTYAIFVGFGEEIIYRGYMQSRLNEAFGRPYEIFGVRVGWGMVIASLFFGLTHVGLLRWLTGLSDEVTWAWGFWTFFGGLVFGFVREKSGGILASALLHGLPQAIATVVILYY